MLFAIYEQAKKIVKLPLKMDYTFDDNARLLKPGEKGDKNNPNESNQRRKRDVYQVKTSGVVDLVGEIRIFNGCELQIENPVTRVTVRHHERCRTVIPSDGIFSTHQTTIMCSFSCILFL